MLINAFRVSLSHKSQLSLKTVKTTNFIIRIVTAVVQFLAQSLVELRGKESWSRTSLLKLCPRSSN